MSEESRILNDSALDILFRDARTYNSWEDTDVSEVLIRAVYDLMRWGPTSMNCSPARFVFVKSPEAKERLKPHLMGGNVEKTMSAPMTAIIANHMEFYEELPKLFPHNEGARDFFAGKDAYIADTAMRNGTLQAAYLMLAARSLGLDCGPMSGFSSDGVKEEFFPDENVEINMLCNIGYGTEEKLHPRLPRFDFDDICQIV